MNYGRLLSLVLIAATTLVSATQISGQGTWESTLLGRDAMGHTVSGSSPDAVFLYDTALNITWLKDANANGQMTWTDANSWVQSLQVGGFSGWRLPTVPEPDTSCTTSSKYLAVYSLGYGINCTNSEMGHLFNVTLGNAPDQVITNTGNFINVQNYYYWSGTPLASRSDYVWTYQTAINGQAYTGTGANPFFALAVRDGDVLVTTTTSSTAAPTTTTTSTSTTTAAVSTTTTSPQTTTTVATTTTTTLTNQPPLQIEVGWNLLGNTTDKAINVADTFSSTAVITTIWKWAVAVPGWQFYTPSMDATALQAYASSKGYGVLAMINPGEGFWVNAKTKAPISMAAGNPYSVGSGELVTGWNLVATAANATPATFNLSLTDPLAPPPTVGVVPLNITTLWAWDSTQSKWYFYAPSYEAQGGTALIDYITGKGYLDFTSANKTLGNGVGFWVNKP